ncbi:metal ABC transporter ATP-binding protein [Enterococcus faecium]|nr:metal ABC transporter ATP-binding protein [Enterococcus faecium]
MRYIEISDLTFYYDDEPVLEDVSYHVDAGEFVILTGENGAAKSTLVKASLGLLKPSKGMIKIAEKNQEGKKLGIGYIPQQVASFNAGFPSTVIELVRSGRYPRGRWFKRLSEKDHQHVQRALEAVGMWDMRNRRIGELSGGQKQRISLARIFATDPDLFVLDEPTTGMDEESRNEFYRLLRHSAHVHGKSVLMITHDHEDIKQYADRQIRLVRKEDSQWRCFHMNS